MIPQEQQQLFFNVLRAGRGFIGWKTPKGRYQQAAFETSAEALALIAAHPDANIWCAMAGFGPDANREAANALFLKAFWLDVDAHGKGPHETPKDALDGIKAVDRRAKGTPLAG